MTGRSWRTLGCRKENAAVHLTRTRGKRLWAVNTRISSARALARYSSRGGGPGKDFYKDSLYWKMSLSTVSMSPISDVREKGCHSWPSTFRFLETGPVGGLSRASKLRLVSRSVSTTLALAVSLPTIALGVQQ